MTYPLPFRDFIASDFEHIGNFTFDGSVNQISYPEGATLYNGDYGRLTQTITFPRKTTMSITLWSSDLGNRRTRLFVNDMISPIYDSGGTGLSRTITINNVVFYTGLNTIRLQFACVIPGSPNYVNTGFSQYAYITDYNNIVECVPNWQCRLPLDGYEHDANNCGELDRLNPVCNAPCIPDWQCRQPPDGYEHDVNNCGEPDRLNPTCDITCESIIITPDKTSAYIGNIINLNINVLPTTQTYNVDIRDSYNTLIGNCVTSGGICTINWSTENLVAGQYSLVGYVSSLCISPPILITLLENCTSLLLSSDSYLARIGSTLILTVNSEPTTQIYNIDIRDSYNTLIESCITSDGICTYNWDTTDLLAGEYILTARIIDVPGEECISNSISIILLPVCPLLTITPDKIFTYVGDTILFTINTLPSFQPYSIEVRDSLDNLIGNCTILDGSCTINWSTTGLSTGQYDLTARTIDSSLEECATASTSIILQPLISLMNSPWPKFHGDIRNSGFANARSTADGTIKWELPILSEIATPEIGSPAIAADGTIYVVPSQISVYNPDIDDYEYRSYLIAINPDGTLKWTHDLFPDPFPDLSPIRFVQGDPITGSFPTPAIDNNGTIYIVGCYPERGGLLAAINQDGTFKWSSLVDGDCIYSSPVIGNDNTIYICRQSWGDINNGLTALDQDGIVKWNYITNSDVYNSPAISSDGRIWISNTDGLFTIDQTGNLLNQISLNAIFNSPTIGKDDTVYIVDSNISSILAIDPTDYSIKWTSPTIGNVETGEVASCCSPVIDDDDNVIYALSSTDPNSDSPVVNTVHSISTTDGSINWLYNVGEANRSYILLVDKNGTVYTYGTINDNRSFIAIDKDGNLKWSSPIDTYRSSPAMDNMGIIYSGTYYGSVIAFDSCITDWQCRIPLDGYEYDINNCVETDRLNQACNPCIPDWQCRIPLDGYEHDINNCVETDRLNPDCISNLNTIIISPDSISLNIGETQQLTAECTNQFSETMECPILEWSSTDNSIATVDSNGLVAAISPGIANISCSNGDIDSNYSITTVTQVVEEGFGGLGAIIGIGLLFGILYQKDKCDIHRTRKECEDSGCKWLNGRCIKQDKK